MQKVEEATKRILGFLLQYAYCFGGIKEVSHHRAEGSKVHRLSNVVAKPGSNTLVKNIRHHIGR